MPGLVLPGLALPVLARKFAGVIVAPVKYCSGKKHCQISNNTTVALSAPVLLFLNNSPVSPLQPAKVPEQTE